MKSRNQSLLRSRLILIGIVAALVVIGAVAVTVAVWIGRRNAQPRTYPLHSPASGVIYEVDCGGAGDLPFSGRYGFVGGRAIANSVAGGAGSIQRAALAPAEAYLTERSGPKLGYKFRVGRGWYEVQLHFVELKHLHQKDRLFDVRIEGKTVTARLDILAEAYPQAALVKRYAVWIDDGLLDVELEGQTGDAKIDFIRVRRMDISSDWVPLRIDPP